MGLLDELKKQAETHKQQLLSGQASKEQNRQAVHALLREVSRQLKELADSLNVLKPKVIRQFYIGQAKLDGLTQCEYNARDRRVPVSGQDYIEETALSFRCIGLQPLKVERNSPDAIKKLSEYLWGYSFRFECQEFRNDRMMLERAIFTVLPEVASAATFAGNLDTGKIRLTLKNIETAGNVDFQYEIDEVNRELVDELAKLVLGRSNQLRKLGCYQQMMSTTTRLAYQRMQDPEPPRPAATGMGATPPAGQSAALNSPPKR